MNELSWQGLFGVVERSSAVLLYSSRRLTNIIALRPHSFALYTFGIRPLESLQAAVDIKIYRIKFIWPTFFRIIVWGLKKSIKLSDDSLKPFSMRHCLPGIKFGNILSFVSYWIGYTIRKVHDCIQLKILQVLSHRSPLFWPTWTRVMKHAILLGWCFTTTLWD